MRQDIQLDFRARPSALAFMARAVRPSPGLKKSAPNRFILRLFRPYDSLHLRITLYLAFFGSIQHFYCLLFW